MDEKVTVKLLSDEEYLSLVIKMGSPRHGYKMEMGDIMVFVCVGITDEAYDVILSRKEVNQMQYNDQLLILSKDDIHFVTIYETAELMIDKIIFNK